MLLLPGAAAATAAATRKEKKRGSGSTPGLPSWELDAFAERMVDLSGPILQHMGFSGLLGMAAAAALKWVGRTMAAAVGLGLILVQVLSHHNIVTVNWSAVHKQAAQVLDATGDGRLDKDDYKRFIKQGLIILSEGVPSVSGFLLGFLLGMKVF